MLLPGTPAGDSAVAIAAGPIHRIENHDGAVAVWRDAGVAQRVLVHVDAHHDMYGKWIDEEHPGERARINIANFVYAALEEGLVREVIWVVPDQTWATGAGRRDVVRSLRRLDQGHGRRKPGIRIQPDRIWGAALGRPVQVCTARNLPAVEEAVLLDIDIDYFAIPNVGYREIAIYGALPWCWPSELLTSLQSRGIHTDLTTIAYSVEGGYTPLQWKYLGDELDQRLQPAPRDLAWADRMRSAAEAAERADFASAEMRYLAAHRLRPDAAATCYHLAHLYVATGRSQTGHDYLREARRLDPSYRTPFSNAGLWYLGKHRHDDARAAFLRMLSLDPDDVYAHLGCGLLALREARWSAAESSLRRALALDDRCIAAYRALGEVLAQRRDYAGAMDLYQRSLKLALSGQRVVTNAVTLGQLHDWREPWDPDHGAVHAELARLHAATGAWAAAIAGYRMAIVGGADTAGAWASVAMLCGRMSRWRDCGHALYQSALRVPRACGRRLRRLWSRSRAAIDRWRDARASRQLAGAKPRIWT